MKARERNTIWTKNNGPGQVSRKALVHVPKFASPFSCRVYPSSPMIQAESTCVTSVYGCQTRRRQFPEDNRHTTTNLTIVLPFRFNKGRGQTRTAKSQTCIGYRRENARTRIMVCISVVILFTFLLLLLSPSSRCVLLPFTFPLHYIFLLFFYFSSSMSL
jgi:hypothetical protein